MYTRTTLSFFAVFASFHAAQIANIRDVFARWKIRGQLLIEEKPGKNRDINDVVEQVN